MSLKPGRASGVSADNAHGVIRPTPQRMQASPGPPESLAGQATAPGFSSPTPPARRRTSPAGGAGRHRTGCAVRRGGCRRGFPYRAADRRGAGPAPARWHGRQALAPTVEALPLICRVAALPWTSPSPSWRSSWAKRSCMSERSAATPGRSAPGCRRNARRYRPAPRPVRPRPLPLPARPWRRSCRDDRAGKAPGAPCRSASPHGRSCPPPGGFAVGQRGVGGHGGIGSPAKRPSARILQVASRPSISGICMSISTASNGTLASSTC